MSLLISISASAGWKMTFNDEFSGTGVDYTRWIPTDGWGDQAYDGKGTLQCWIPEALSTSNGLLSITAWPKTFTSCYPLKDASTVRYASGMLSTARSFAQLYGYFEIRAKEPKGQGLWTNIWLLPKNPHWPPELNIAEWIGTKPTTMYMTYHWADPVDGSHRATTNSYTGPAYSDEFHIFGVDWQAGLLTWYIDGVMRRQLKGEAVSAESMYLLMDMAVGGTWAGPPNSSTVFPATMQVDYVRAYARINDGQPDAIPPFGGLAPPQALTLLRSSNSDRSNAVPISGSISGNLYAFVPDPGGIAKVEFLLDGTLFHTENLAPWDFNGTAATANLALPFNTANLASGVHTIVARATMKSATVQTASASFSVGPSPTAPSGILLSYAPDRSNAVDLNGRTLTGNVYMFVASSGVSQVRFSIDGKLVKIENIAPFDLAGTSTNGSTALAFNASSLTPGTHTVQAQLSLSNGASKTATATVYH
ncbi:MAG: family 16 glycosylhydrolase [Methylotetracoccus sp.]